MEQLQFYLDKFYYYRDQFYSIFDNDLYLKTIFCFIIISITISLVRRITNIFGLSLTDDDIDTSLFDTDNEQDDIDVEFEELHNFNPIDKY